MHEGLIACISSSIRSGQVEQLVDRTLHNLTTLNEEHSYIGIDLSSNI